MEIYKYGPLVYNTPDSEEDTGNFYWSGSPPVGYDSQGMPVDDKGFQCLDMNNCPIHPNYPVPDESKEPNEFLGLDIPTLNSFNSWFEDTFIKANPRDLALFIIRWIDFQNESSAVKKALYNKCATMDIDDIIDNMWPSLKAD